jgi:hypothetical protein
MISMHVPTFSPFVPHLTLLRNFVLSERPISTSCRHPNAEQRERGVEPALRLLKGTDAQALGPRHRHIDECFVGARRLAVVMRERPLPLSSRRLPLRRSTSFAILGCNIMRRSLSRL